MTEVYESIVSAIQKAYDNVAHRYTKGFVIETFTSGTVVIVRVSKEHSGTLDHARLYAQVINQTHLLRYKLQTEHIIFYYLFPARKINQSDDPTLAGLSLISPYIYTYI